MAIPLTLEQRFIYDSALQWQRHALWRHLYRCVRLTGNADIYRFGVAISDLLMKNEVLSARLVVANDMPLQYTVVTTLRNCLAVAEMRDTGLNCIPILAEHVRRKFDLGREPPMRISLLLTSDGTYMLLVAHPLFIDLPAFNFLWDQLLRGLLADSDYSRDQHRTNERQSYFDYGLTQGMRIADGSLCADAEQYIARLATAHQRLPSARSGGASLTGGGVQTQCVTRILEPVLASRVRDRARHCGVPLTRMLEATAFRALAQLSGKSLLLMNAVVDTRRPPFTDCVGQFADIALVPCESVTGGESAVRTALNIALQLLDFSRTPVPSEYLSSRFPSLKARVAEKEINNFAVYYVREPEAAWTPPSDGTVSEVDLLQGGNSVARHRLDTCPVAFVIHDDDSSCKLSLEFTPNVIDDTLARRISSAWLDELTQLAIGSAQE